MARVRPETFFESRKRQKSLIRATVVFFLFLAAETVFSGITAVYEMGGTHLDFYLPFTKVLSVMIYMSMAVLIHKKISYKLLLIPDFFLLVIKLYYVISGIRHITTLNTVGIYTTLSEWEHITENALFCLFLITLFACKLLPSRESIHLKLPYICLSALILCFPFTVTFEVVKAINETSLHSLTFKGALFNFFMNVLNEAVLDLPYALLLIVIFFVPQEQKKGNKKYED